MEADKPERKIEIPELINIDCEVHDGEICQNFCQDCEEVVCPLCRSTIHQKHNLIQICEGYNISLDKISKSLSKLHNHRQKLEEDISALDSILSNELWKYETQKKHIAYHDKALKEAVENNTIKFLNDLEERWHSLNHSVQTERTLAINRKSNIHLKTKVLDKVLNSKCPGEVFGAVKRKHHHEEDEHRPVIKKYKRLPKFVPGEINCGKLDSIYGTWRECNDTSSIVDVNFQVLDQYTTNLPVIGSIACCEDESVWINNNATSTLQNVNFQSGLMQINNSLKVTVANIALTHSGDLLVSVYEPNLKILAKSSEELVSSNFSVLPLVTSAVHVSRDRRVIVGAQQDKHHFPARGTRQVIEMDMEGRHKHVYENDNNSEPLFTFPRRIASDSHNNIYVLDTLSSDYRGRIVMLGHGGIVVRGIYTGNKIVNTDCPFTPTDLVATKFDNIIITDSKNSMLHVLNSDGQCILFKSTVELKIELPRSVDIDTHGQLFIGCNTYKHKPDRANIYAVKISGL